MTEQATRWYAFDPYLYADGFKRLVACWSREAAMVTARQLSSQGIPWTYEERPLDQMHPNGRGPHPEVSAFQQKIERLRPYVDALGFTTSVDLLTPGVNLFVWFKGDNYSRTINAATIEAALDEAWEQRP